VGLTIILRATTQLQNNAAARDAFTRAAAKWEALINDPITVVIDVDFGTTFFGTPYPPEPDGSPSRILGQTDGQSFRGSLGDIRSRLIGHANNAQETAFFGALPTANLPTDIGPTSNVIAEGAVLRALGALNPNADPATETSLGDPPRIGFNSRFSFDFDPTNGVTGTDFDSVAVHEIGHVLGFDSFVGDRELRPTAPILVSVWDLFRFRPGTTLSSFTSAPRILSTGGTQVYFDGSPELPLSTGNPEGNGGDGEQSRDFTYVSNVVDANLRAAESAQAVGQVINVANGRRTTLNELLDALKELTGKADVEPEYRETRVGDVRHSLADITRARELLGYEPRVGLEEGLRLTLDWWNQSRFARS
jgi:hypothetical protein